MGATIFAGSKVKHLKAEAQLLSGSSRISGSVDPTSSAVSAEPGSIYQNSTTGAIYRKLDSGSSTNWVQLASGSESGINYITNPGAESNTTGWATYDDGAVTRPVNATGGTASNVTWSRSTTTPLRGLADFNLVKGAADAQGEGVSFDFSIASADKGKLLGLEFECELISGTYSSGTSSTDSDLVLVIYDVTNAVNLEPIPLKLSLPISGVTSKFYATFPASSNSTSYRLALHVATTSTSAYTVAFDSFKIGPVATINQVPMTDPVQESVTLTSSGGGSITLDTGAGYQAPIAIWSQRGKMMRIQYAFRNGNGGAATGSAGSVYLSVPNGQVIDTSVLTPQLGGTRGDGFALDSGVITQSFMAFSSTQIAVLVDATDNYLQVSDLAAGYFISGVIEVPIVGWSSNVTTVAPQVQGGTVGLRVQGQPTGTLNGSFNKVTYPTTVSDTAGTYSSGAWTVPVTGYYDLGAGASITGDVTTSSSLEFIIYNTTTATTLAYSEKRFTGSLSGAFFQTEQLDRKFVLLQAGDVYEVRIAITSIASAAYSSNTTTSYFSASLVSAVQQIPADSKSKNVRTITANATILPTDDIIKVDASGGAVTATMSLAAGTIGKEYVIEKIDSSTNKVTIARSGSDTIGGLTAIYLGSQTDSATLNSDGVSRYTMRLDAPIACSVLPASQGITEDTTTTIDLDSVQYDPWGMVSTASDTVTVPLPGIYRLNSQTWIDATPNKDNGVFVSYYSVNGGADQFLATTNISNFGAGQSITTEATKEILLAAGDVIRFRLYKDFNTGASTDNLIPSRCFYQLTKVR